LSIPILETERTIFHYLIPTRFRKYCVNYLIAFPLSEQKDSKTKMTRKSIFWRKKLLTLIRFINYPAFWCSKLFFLKKFNFLLMNSFSHEKIKNLTQELINQNWLLLPYEKASHTSFSKEDLQVKIKQEWNVNGKIPQSMERRWNEKAFICFVTNNIGKKKSELIFFIKS